MYNLFWLICEAFILLLLAAFQECLSCSIENEIHCTCDIKINQIKCSSIDQSLDSILLNLVPRNIKYLTLQKSWSEEPTRLTSEHLSHFRKLRIFDVSDNWINGVEPGTFSNFPFLRKIDLSNNRIRILEKNAFSGYLPQMEYLNLARNRILVLLESTFSSVNSLRHLDLRNNALVYIANNAFRGLHKLKSLKLERCNITAFPNHAIKPLTNLTDFEARKFYFVDSIPAYSFQKNSKLRSIYLEEFNRLESNRIHIDAFAGLNELHHLTVSACNLTRPPSQALQKLRSLKSLDLSRNPITAIDSEDFINLLHLETLNLRQTGLRNIMDGAFGSLISLKLLNLSNNRLESLRRTAFPEQLLSLKNISLRENSWCCDCRISWIVNSKINTDVNAATCANPPMLRGRNLKSLQNTNLSCVKMTATNNSSIEHLDISSARNAVFPHETTGSLHPMVTCVSLTDVALAMAIDTQEPVQPKTKYAVKIRDSSNEEANLCSCTANNDVQNNVPVLNVQVTRNPRVFPSRAEKEDDLSVFASLLIGVLGMFSCLGFLATFLFALNSYKIKKENEKLKENLNNILKRKVTFDATACRPSGVI